MSSRADQRLIEALEDRITTINEYLEVLAAALQNANSERLEREILKRIDRQTRELARAQRDRDAAARRIARKDKE